jgi:hypothetical protein
MPASTRSTEQLGDDQAGFFQFYRRGLAPRLSA